MAEDPRPSNWHQATQRPALAVELVCSKCHAANRPGAEIIQVQDGVACCGVCAHAWRTP